jgi:uncharacterized protein (DUF2235 family)
MRSFHEEHGPMSGHHNVLTPAPGALAVNSRSISNIYKMYRISRDHADTGIKPSQQVVFYDAGLGTDVGATAFTAPARFVQKMLGSVAGDGIKRNIADCYEFVVNHYEEGDRIFLFGFSRGAYTVRSLANLLMLCGVPMKTPDGHLMR